MAVVFLLGELLAHVGDFAPPILANAGQLVVLVLFLFQEVFLEHLEAAAFLLKPLLIDDDLGVNFQL